LQENRVGVDVAASQDEALLDHGELKGDPGRDDSHTGHRRRGRIDDVGQLDPRHTAAIGQFAAHPADHHAVGQAIEEAEQAQTRGRGLEASTGIAARARQSSEQGAETAACVQHRSESAEDEGKGDGAGFPGAGQTGRQMITEDGEVGRPGIAVGQQHRTDVAAYQQAGQGPPRGQDHQQGSQRRPDGAQRGLDHRQGRGHHHDGDQATHCARCHGRHLFLELARSQPIPDPRENPRNRW